MVSYIGYTIGLLGMWIIWDGISSWTLYANAPAYDGRKQTFKEDHWLRLVRILCGITFVVLGALV